MASSDFKGSVIGADPAVLIETAEAAFRQIAAYREGLEAISKLIMSSESFWVGEAGDAYRAVFKAELSKVEETLDEYAAYPAELLEYHQLYSDVIAKAAEHADSVSDFQMA